MSNMDEPNDVTGAATLSPKVGTDGGRPIPERVLREFDAQVHQLRPEPFVSLALLMRATGWTLAALLDLRIDTCLRRDEHGWWLCNGSEVTHRAPIGEDVALALEAQMLRARSGRVGAANLTRHVFVNCGPRASGNRLIKEQVRVAMNRFAHECNITDHNGDIYPLTAGAFRRTKYAELVRSGLDMASIQIRMNDESVFMTIRNIQRQSGNEVWRQALANGPRRHASKP